MAANDGTVTALFTKTHRELDALFRGVDFDSPGAQVMFDEFDRRLERHLRWEEELLFPAVAKVAPIPDQGPLFLMAEEHKEIRRAKSAVLESLGFGDAAGAKARAARLAALMTQHEVKEERILYPACDQLLPATERERILARARPA